MVDSHSAQDTQEPQLNRAQRRAAKKGKASKVERTALQQHRKLVRAAGFMSTLAMNRAYDAGPIIGDESRLHEQAMKSQAKSLHCVRSAFVRLCEGTTDTLDDLVTLAEAFGVTVVRAIDIADEKTEDNPLLQVLHHGQQALQAISSREERWGKWQVLEAERGALDEAINVYVEIITNSTPQQMESASLTRKRMLVESRRIRDRASKNETQAAL